MRGGPMLSSTNRTYRGLGCTSRSCLGCNGLGCSVSTTSDGLGAVAGPDLLEQLRREAEGLYASFLSLESQLASAIGQLAQAEGIAQTKNQFKLLSEVQAAHRAGVQMMTRYTGAKAQLTATLNDLRQTTIQYAGGQIGVLQVALTSARIAAQSVWLFSSVRQLVVDIPRFGMNAAALVERVRGAATLAPSTPVSQIPGQVTGNLAQITMWAAVGILAVTVLPKLVKD